MTEASNLARDHIAKVYMGLRGDDETIFKARNRIDWLASQVTEGDVLDIGCSEGILPVLLGRTGNHVLGIDINLDAIRYAEDMLSGELPDVRKNVAFIAGDIFKEDLDNRHFDVVILGEVLEHFSEPHLLVERASQFLVDGGQIFVTTPYGYFPDPDHRTTFILSHFLPLFKEEFSPLHLSIEDGYIRLAARKEKPKKTTWEDKYSYQFILRMVEGNFVEVQKKRYEARISLREALAEANSKYRKAEENYQKVKKQYAALLYYYEDFKNSLSYKLVLELKKAFSPPGIATIKFPLKIAKHFYRWYKNRGKTAGSISTNQMAAQSITSDVSADLAEQDLSFQNDLEEFLELANKRVDKPVVVLSTGTKRMGIMKRLNRTMAFATEMAKLEIPVIYVYYRFRKSDDFQSDYKKEFNEYLLQLPNDLFHTNADKIARTIVGDNKIFINSIPDIHVVNEIDLFNFLGWHSIYEVRDDWEEFYKAGVGKWYAEEYEKYACSKADMVTTVSVFLREKMIGLGAHPERTFIVPNGLRQEFFDQTRDRFSKRKEGYTGENIIGYFGHLTEKWFNWDLLIATAKANPQWQFEIIGFGAPETLYLPQNITLLGEKTHEEIIEIASRWRVATIPFKQSKLARAVDPIKIYEYLALGLPVVSCYMDNILDYPFTYIYEKDDNFSKKLREAMETALSKEQSDALEKFTEDSTWRARVMKTFDLLQKVLQERG